MKGRVEGRVVSRAVVVATGVTASGDREVLGVEVGDSEDGVFWTAFLRGLRARGLSGVQLVISDHHLGLKAAIGSPSRMRVAGDGDVGVLSRLIAWHLTTRDHRESIDRESEARLKSRSCLSAQPSRVARRDGYR